MIRTVVLALMLASTPALADVRVVFLESAPKDRFVITNTSACPTGALEVTIDLGASAAGLIFDTTGAGAGVEVFQPFELVTGHAHVTAVSKVSDGDRLAVLEISDIPGKGEIAFTIDVDDTLPASANGQIMVSGGEIAGSRLQIRSTGGAVVTAPFDGNGAAVARWEACLS
ncbi:MAG: hypothetical protein AAGH68_05335 [Pseudomonadota bacterium]